jgi:hypothetical protein
MTEALLDDRVKPPQERLAIKPTSILRTAIHIKEKVVALLLSLEKDYHTLQSKRSSKDIPRKPIPRR